MDWYVCTGRAVEVRVILACVGCESGNLIVLAKGRLFPHEGSTVFRCLDCRQDQVLTHRLAFVVDRSHEGARALHAACGTDSGYSRHRKLKEEACDDCRRAHADSVRARYLTNPRKRRSRSKAA